MIDREALLELDIYKACYHEAGHLVALLALGGEGFIRIADEPDEVDPVALSTRIGQVSVLSLPPDPEGQRVISLAGVVGESLHEAARDEGNPESALDLLAEELETGEVELSATDAKGAEGWTLDTLERTARLLRAHWDWVEHYALTEASKLLDVDAPRPPATPLRGVEATRGR